MSKDRPPPSGEIILYQTEDGGTRIDVRMDGETVWLTQAQMAELFQTTPQNVTLHLQKVYAEGELAEMATCKDFLQVRREGARNVFTNVIASLTDLVDPQGDFKDTRRRNPELVRGRGQVATAVSILMAGGLFRSSPTGRISQ